MNKLGIKPWFSIWVKPAKTIQNIIDYNPNYCLGFLSFIYGITSLFSLSQSLSLGFNVNFFAIIIADIIIATFWGYFVFCISSFFVFFTGKWFGGKAIFKHVRACVAWSNVPMIINIVIWIILLAVFKDRVFRDFTKTAILGSGTSALLYVFMLIQFVLSIWGIVIYINSLAQVQQFSIIRTICNIIVAAIIMAICVSVVFYIFAWILSLF